MPMETQNKRPTERTTNPQEFWKNYFSGSPYRKLVMGILYLGDHNERNALQLRELEDKIEYLSGACKKSTLYKQLKILSGQTELSATPLLCFRKKNVISNKHKERASIFPVAQAMIEKESNFARGKYLTLIFCNPQIREKAAAYIKGGLASSLGASSWIELVLAAEEKPAMQILKNLCSSRIIEEDGRNLADGYRPNYPKGHTAHSGAELKEKGNLDAQGIGNKLGRQAVSCGRQTPGSGRKNDAPGCTRVTCEGSGGSDDTRGPTKRWNRRTRALLRRHGVFPANFQRNPGQVPLIQNE